MNGLESDVYIVFGDIPRADGDNIWGVFTNLESAKKAVERLKERRPFEEFDIEEHQLWI